MPPELYRNRSHFGLCTSPTQCISVANPIAFTQPLDWPSSRCGRLATIDRGFRVTSERDSTSQPAMAVDSKCQRATSLPARLQYLLTSAVHFWSDAIRWRWRFDPKFTTESATAMVRLTSLVLVPPSCSWVRSAIRRLPDATGSAWFSSSRSRDHLSAYSGCRRPRNKAHALGVLPLDSRSIVAERR